MRLTRDRAADHVHQPQDQRAFALRLAQSGQSIGRFA